MGIEFTLSFKGEGFVVDQRPELTIGHYAPWCVAVNGAWYEVGTDVPEARHFGKDFLRIGLQNASPRLPGFLASSRYPLRLLVDGVPIRAWPLSVSSDRWPVWMFSAAHREASECGSIGAEQSLDDVIDLAKIWLRSARPHK